MSFNQIRAAGDHQKNQHRKPLVQQKLNQAVTSPWRHHHYRSNSIPSSFGQDHPMRGQRLTYPPVQALHNEPSRPRIYTDFHGSGASNYGSRNTFQAMHRSDNRGYPQDPERRLEPITSHLEQDISARGQRLTYPPVQALQNESNRPRLYTEFHGSDSSSFHNANPFQPVLRADNRGYSCIQDTKRQKTEFGRFPASAYCPPALPSPQVTTNSRILEPAPLPTFDSIYGPAQNTEDSSRKGNASPFFSNLVPSRKRTHSHDEGVAAVVSEPSNDDSSISSTNNHPRLLALPEDTSHLTALHCLVRRRCVYTFCAKAHEVDVPRKGRKKPLALGQVGIGCIHCKDSPTKLKGCSYFPSSISGIYNATMIIIQRHFPVCPSVTKEVYGEYNKLKGLTARSASTKEYWIMSAKKLGMIDTKDGVFFRSMRPGHEDTPSPQAKSFDVTQGNDVSKIIQSNTPLCSLVEPSDRVFATEYAYFVMAQMTTCTFTESDRLGKRKGHTVGFPGLACKYCYGGNGSGRFFPLTLKTFSDVSKSLHVLRNHLVKCAKAPAGLATKVTMLYEQHKNDKDITPFGSQKIFFDHVWRRLHPELSEGSKKPASKHSQLDTNMSSSPEETMDNDALSTIYPSFGMNMDSKGSSQRTLYCRDIAGNDVELGSSLYRDTDMPPLPPAPETGAAHYPSIQNQLEANEKIDEPIHRGPVKKRLLNLYHNNSEAGPVQYSDADVSVAMILATGMGRQDSPVTKTAEC